jgi:long-chain-fatty-acid--CoA ligase ACSBG
MMTHDNICYTIYNFQNDFNFKPFGEHYVSFLPLSHVVAQIVDVYYPIFLGTTVYFAQPDALKGTLIQTLKEVRPTFILGKFLPGY